MRLVLYSMHMHTVWPCMGQPVVTLLIKTLHGDTKLPCNVGGDLSKHFRFSALSLTVSVTGNA